MLSTSMTPTELVATFPEALPIVKRNLSIWKKYRKEVEPLRSELLDELMKLVYINGNEVEQGLKWVQKYFYDRPMREIDGHVARLTHLLSLYQNAGKEKRQGEITEEDIESAKRYPVSSYLMVNRSGFVTCPFHEDKRPSAKYYENKNKIHCFVCNTSYDIIDIVSKLNGIEFLDAVRLILKR